MKTNLTQEQQTLIENLTPIQRKVLCNLTEEQIKMLDNLTEEQIKIIVETLDKMSEEEKEKIKSKIEKNGKISDEAFLLKVSGGMPSDDTVARVLAVVIGVSVILVIGLPLLSKFPPHESKTYDSNGDMIARTQDFDHVRRIESAASLVGGVANFVQAISYAGR